jgi:hypothetical protein
MEEVMKQKLISKLQLELDRMKETVNDLKKNVGKSQNG